MAVREGIKGEFYYIHNNYNNALQALKDYDYHSHITNAEEMTIRYTLDYQKKREEKIYKTLGIDLSSPIPAKKLYEKLYGTKFKDEKEIDNKLDQALRLLNQFFLDMYTFDGRNIFEDENSEKPTDAQKLVSRMYNIKKNLGIWLEKTDLDQNLIEASELEQIANDSMNYWNTEIKEKLLEKDGIDLKVDTNGELIGIIDETSLNKILQKYKSYANDIFGSLSEKGGESLMNGIAGGIMYSTSREMAETNKQKFKGRIEFKNFFKDIDKLNNTDLSKDGDINARTLQNYKMQLENNIERIRKIHNINTPFFKLNIKNVNPKADQVFVLNIETEIEPEFLTFGVSNKMGHTSNKSLKIQSTSLYSILSNSFLTQQALAKMKFSNYVTEVLTNMFINEAGVLQWKIEKPLQGTLIKDILTNLVNTFAYVWLTGGDLDDKTHADFFMMTKNGVVKKGKKNILLPADTYFVSMSSILEKVLKLFKDSASSGFRGGKQIFGTIGYNKELISKQELTKISNLKKYDKDGNLIETDDLKKKMLDVSMGIIQKISKSEQTISISNYGILVGK